MYDKYTNILKYKNNSTSTPINTGVWFSTKPRNCFANPCLVEYNTNSLCILKTVVCLGV